MLNSKLNNSDFIFLGNSLIVSKIENLVFCVPITSRNALIKWDGDLQPFVLLHGMSKNVKVPVDRQLILGVQGLFNILHANYQSKTQ